MERTYVSSSNIKSIGFDKANSKLEIEFHSGGIYQYSGVPAYVYQSLMNASSHGKFFSAYIKNIYSFIQLS